MTRANMEKRPGEVSAMFDKVADRYDLLNDVLSLGQDRWWRRMVARTVAARPGERVLDVAAGTGTSSRTFTAAGADCVACDFSLGMLTVGARRLRRPAELARGDAPPDPPDRRSAPRPASPAGPARRVRFVAGDAMRLPFRDQAFDAVTISFGLRNVADHEAALAEFRRVTRPGGRLVVCEFGHLPWPRLNSAYEAYLTGALPVVARRLSGNPAAYEYLAESIQDWPAQPELARRIAAAGWSAVRWRDLSLGVVAIHQARRPG
ncbi:MAG TPA: demethylmenaquinone methyltransferase [Streptosporangiaceae bacterium]|jgi:demethylmenaquinone methyltransferase/2-methoxy-6-polyprenyl-1,4-benzoquinol methylase